MTRKIIVFFLLLYPLSLFAATKSSLTARPEVAVQPMVLDWKKISFPSNNYSVFPVNGGAEIYTMPSSKTQRFSLKVVLPLNVFSLDPSEFSAFQALAWLLSGNGFADLSVEKLEKILIENAISVNTELVNNQLIMISFEALSRDFDTVLGLLSSLLFSPNLSQASLNAYLAEKKEEFLNNEELGSLDKQKEFMSDKVDSFLYGPNNFYTRVYQSLEPKELAKVTIDQVEKLYKKALNKNGLKSFLVGNYGKSNLGKLSQLLNKMPSFPLNGPIYLPERIKNTKVSLQARDSWGKPQTILIQKKGMTQCNLSLRYYFPYLGELNEKEKGKFFMLGKIFSTSGEVMGNDRFSNAMRLQSGISYAPLAYFRTNINEPNTNLNAVYMNFQSPNDRLLEAIRLAQNTWNTFVLKGVSQSELNTTKYALINQVLATENSIFTEGNELFDSVLNGELPKRNPMEYHLAHWEEQDSAKELNEFLQTLRTRPAIPVLVIMGDLTPKEIRTLGKSGLLNIKKSP